MVQSRYARGAVEVRSRYARGAVEVRSWCGGGTLVVQSRCVSHQKNSPVQFLFMRLVNFSMSDTVLIILRT